MAEQALSTPVPAAHKPAVSRWSGAFVPRLITGLAIILVWEIVVRVSAPAYVAKPSGVLLAIPKVITAPAFLQALGSTLSAVAEGLAITLVIGTVFGLLMGRSPTFDRVFRVYINRFNAMPMIIVLPLFSLWFGYSGAARIATLTFSSFLVGAAFEGPHQQDTRVHPARSHRTARAARAPHPRTRRVGPSKRQDLPGPDGRHLQGEESHRQEVCGSRMILQPAERHTFPARHINDLALIPRHDQS